MPWGPMVVLGGGGGPISEVPLYLPTSYRSKYLGAYDLLQVEFDPLAIQGIQPSWRNPCMWISGR